MASAALIATVADGQSDGTTPSAADLALAAVIPEAGAGNFAVPLRPTGTSIPPTHLGCSFGTLSNEQVAALDDPLRFADGNPYGRRFLTCQPGEFWGAVATLGFEYAPPDAPPPR